MKKYWQILIILLYTLAVSFFVIPMNQNSFFNASESLYFDFLQRRYTIDSRDDEGFKQYASLLSNMVFINIDGLCMDKTTDKVDKKWVASFLDTLAQHKNRVKFVFLDYDLSFLNNQDTLFSSVLKKFDGQLITPRLLFAQNLPKHIANPVSDSLIISYTETYNTENNSGYAYGWKENFTNTYRYYLYRVFTPDLKTYQSVPYLLASHEWPSQNISFDKLMLDDMKEIKFLLRNLDLPNKERAVMVYSMSDVVTQIPAEAFAEIVNGKMVFVGLFENYLNKYYVQPDSYHTPVMENMSGVLITANAFINLLSTNFIETDEGIYGIFLILLFVLMASAMQFWASKSVKYSRAIALYLLFLVISAAILFFIVNVLWLWADVRIHFISTLLASVLSWPIIAIFRK
jgi:hypothetical protein